MEMTGAKPWEEAVQRRDTAFDGAFVRTTGLYCRPGCPSRSPRPSEKNEALLFVNKK
jgi:methylphosphotriester-DNA--protein-cysteine methyltransferase